MSVFKELTCIVCPVGCRLRAALDGDRISIEGNTCPRGQKYGLDELCSPVRMLTTTVYVEGGFLPRLPVRTKHPIPKGKVREALVVLSGLKLEAPVLMGQVIVEDIAGSGVAVVASRPMERA
jgi:CxxC motif-containing protein